MKTPYYSYNPQSHLHLLLLLEIIIFILVITIMIITMIIVIIIIVVVMIVVIIITYLTKRNIVEKHYTMIIYRRYRIITMEMTIMIATTLTPMKKNRRNQHRNHSYLEN